MLAIDNIPGAQNLLAEIESLRRQPTSEFENFFSSKCLLGNGHGAESEYRLCNLVMQGGGVLGLAHVGFLYGLECAGIRVACVAGTSAGSIVATAIVCARKGDIEPRVAGTLLGIIASMPMNQFLDGPASVRKLIKRCLAKRSLLNPGLWPGMLLALKRLLRVRGLNPGLEFEVWLARTFASLGARSNTELLAMLAKTHGQLKAAGKLAYLFESDDENPPRPAGPEDLLKVIASSLPAGIKFTFPRDNEVLNGRYADASPAEFVRASMAIPGFFEPKYMDPNTTKWNGRVDRQFDKLASVSQRDEFMNTKPIAFVDGGLMSNLPVDAFHLTEAGEPSKESRRSAKEKIPTLVLTLVDKSASTAYAFHTNLKGLVNDVVRLANAVRLQRDRDAVNRVNKDNTIELVDIDTSGHNWLNFTMGEEEMGRLFMKGLLRAHEIIRNPEGVK
ncbi:MAG: patatin-like phospholipase family protein [Aestuariivirga sp.]